MDEEVIRIHPRLTLINSLGIVVREWEMTERCIEIDLSNFTSTLYFLILAKEHKLLDHIRVSRN